MGEDNLVESYKLLLELSISGQKPLGKLMTPQPHMIKK